MSDSNQKLSVGIIGAGRIGKVHASAIAFGLPQARVVAITDLDPGAAERVARHCGIPKVAASAEEILADRSIDAVLICTPTATHADLIVKAAVAGKHIFCEKPIDFSLDRIDDAVNAVERAGVKFQIGFNRRFDANFARVRRAVASGEIGQPQLLHIVSRDPAPPPPGYVAGSGGIFLDMAIHDFDMARFLLGEDVDEVYTAGAVLIDPEIGAVGDLDTAVTVLRFRGGAIGTIDNSRKAVFGYDQRVEILGSEGGIATSNCYPNEAVISTSAYVRRDLPLNFFMDRYSASFAAELAAFFEALLTGKPTPVNADDGRAAVVLALAARRSYDLGRPIRVSEIGSAVALV